MIHYDLYRERHKQMIDYQAQIAPFTPTLEELTKVWNVEKTAAAWSLKHLVEMGLCVYRNIGKHKRSYYAVETKNKDTK